MEFFRIKQDIPFMRHALVFNIISLITFLLAVFFLVSKGLHLSIEFTGGTELRWPALVERRPQHGELADQLAELGCKEVILIGGEAYPGCRPEAIRFHCTSGSTAHCVPPLGPGNELGGFAFDTAGFCWQVPAANPLPPWTSR